ncbi:MAG: hypothetical protein NXY57DRAFT_232592 [Lentinula lateritia]|nr:MAG: hypothetical protein NXY57DRAFT_232592 [Lentinula lateritia]
MVQARTVINTLITLRAASVLAAPVPDGVFNALVSRTRETSLPSLASHDPQGGMSVERRAHTDSEGGQVSEASLDFDRVQHTKRVSPSPPGSPASDESAHIPSGLGSPAGSDSGPSSPPASSSDSHRPLIQTDRIPPDLQEKFRYLASRLDSDKEREIYNNAVIVVSGLQDRILNDVVREIDHAPRFLSQIKDLGPADQLRMLFLRAINFKNPPYNPDQLNTWNNDIMKPLTKNTRTNIWPQEVLKLYNLIMRHFILAIKRRDDLRAGPSGSSGAAPSRRGLGGQQGSFDGDFGNEMRNSIHSGIAGRDERLGYRRVYGDDLD